MIGDMVASRKLSATQRSSVQRRFGTLIESLNRKFAKRLLARFVITLGDEFQGLIRDPVIIPDVIWEVQTELRKPDIRLGFGFGSIVTDIPRAAINVDGPALHRARAAIETAHRKKQLGGVFLGFGSEMDAILDGFARILRAHRDRLTDRQLEVAAALRAGANQERAAAAFRITPQAISDHVSSIAWHAYHEAENGWRAAFQIVARQMEKKRA